MGLRGVGCKKAKKTVTKFTQTNALNKENINNSSHLKLVIMDMFCAIYSFYHLSLPGNFSQSPSPAALLRYL